MWKNWPHEKTLSYQAFGKLKTPGPPVRELGENLERDRMNEINVCSTDAKVCDIDIGKLNTYALVDCGADLSLISENVLSKINKKFILPLPKRDFHLVGVTGHSLQTRGYVKIKFNIGTKTLTHDFCVTRKMRHPIILGSDFFVHFGANLDFASKTMAIGNHVVVLKDRPDQTEIGVSLVKTTYRKIILPRSICYLEARVVKPLRADCVFTPLDNCPLLKDQPGLMVPNVICKGNRRIVIPITNETNAKFVINSGQSFGWVEKLGETTINELESVSLGTPTSEELCNSANNVETFDVCKCVNLDHVDSDKKTILRSLFQNYKDRFAKDDFDLGKTDLVKINIDTGTHPPIKQRPYRTPYSERPVVEEYINDMLKSGVISPSNSAWASPIILVDKKDGRKRVCVDFRKVNKILKKNSFPLNNIEDILSNLGQSKWFSTLDLKNGYWQIEVDEKDREKTAFVCQSGLYHFNVMPFGLSSAPPVFQELMNKVLGEAINKYCFAFLDDIIVFSDSFEQHVSHLESIFQKLEKAGLKLKPSKCHFLKEKINFLGHVVSQNGIEPDPEKIDVIQKLRAPRNVREVRSVVGMCSYYRRFIENFSDTVRNLTELTKKNAKFHWTPDHQKSFDQLKEKLANFPVLAHPDLRKPYKLYTDASLYAVGGILTQEHGGHERVIQYLSKKLSPGQQKWPTIEREAYAIVFAINKLRHFLFGSEFTVYTDHKPLRSLFTSEMKNVRIQRWAIMLEEYGCNIEYKQGKTNIPADMLSRIVPDTPENIHEVSVLDSAAPRGKKLIEDLDKLPTLQDPPALLLEEDRVKYLQAKQKEDEILGAIIDSLQSQDEEEKPEGFVMYDDLLHHIANPVKNDQNERLQLVIPESLTESIISEMHSAEFGGGHLGLDKTYDKIRTRYFWFNMYKDVANFLEKCDVCQSRKMKKHRLPMQDMPIPEYPFEIVGIDCCGPFPETANGNKYVVTIIDHFSSWPEAYATKDKTAETMGRLLLEEFIPRHSCPRIILSDRGGEFVNGLISLLLKRMKVCHIKTSPYHPQTNGKTERFHRYMNDFLAKYVQQQQYTWDTYLPGMLMAYRTSVNDTTLHTPFFIVNGRDPVLPLDTLLTPKLKYMGEDYVPCMLQRLHICYSDVKQNMADAREKNKRRLEKQAKDLAYEPGDAVFYYIPSLGGNTSSKLAIHWRPFYRIVEKISPVLYKIKHQQSGKAKIVHAENLRPAHPEAEWDKERPEFENLDPTPENKNKPQPKVPTRIQPPRAAKLVQPPSDFSRKVWIPDLMDVEDSIPPQQDIPKETRTRKLSDGGNDFRPRKRKRLEEPNESNGQDPDAMSTDLQSTSVPVKRKTEILLQDTDLKRRRKGEISFVGAMKKFIHSLLDVLP